MSDFTAIDIELSTERNRASICHIGLVIVKENKIVDMFSYLARPPDNIYSDKCIGIHGITPRQTEHASSFNIVWDKIKNHITNKNVVGHSVTFDIDCLKKCCLYYDIRFPRFNAFCTYKIYKKSLPICCLRYNIKLKHHHALSDAEACALLMLKDIKRK